MPTQDIANVSSETPTLNIFKTGFVIGNDVQWQRTVSGLLFGDTLVNAWLTIKTSPAASDQSGVQVAITLILTGQGQIVGALCTFNMTGQQSIKLNAGPLYYYDIKVQTTPGLKVYTVEQGWIQFLPEVGDLPFPGNASVSLPPAVPQVLFGPNPPPAGLFVVGTRYWVVPPVAGFPGEWAFASDLTWRVLSVVSN